MGRSALYFSCTMVLRICRLKLRVGNLHINNKRGLSLFEYIQENYEVCIGVDSFLMRMPANPQGISLAALPMKDRALRCEMTALMIVYR